MIGERVLQTNCGNICSAKRRHSRPALGDVRTRLAHESRRESLRFFAVARKPVWKKTAARVQDQIGIVKAAARGSERGPRLHPADSRRDRMGRRRWFWNYDFARI